jgi:hypothetical protein
MKKIGGYNRKIGIGIGSSEGGNFAHLWKKSRVIGVVNSCTGQQQPAQEDPTIVPVNVF